MLRGVTSISQFGSSNFDVAVANIDGFDSAKIHASPKSY